MNQCLDINKNVSKQYTSVLDVYFVLGLSNPASVYETSQVTLGNAAGGTSLKSNVPDSAIDLRWYINDLSTRILHYTFGTTDPVYSAGYDSSKYEFDAVTFSLTIKDTTQSDAVSYFFVSYSFQEEITLQVCGK